MQKYIILNSCKLIGMFDIIDFIAIAVKSTNDKQ